ncbi:glycosyltransferase family 4 protein [Patescibacteria group bacterium]
MKIARIIYEWPPPWLGLAPAPYEMTKSQVKLGHTFDIFCARWPKAGPIAGLEEVEFHHVFRVPVQGLVSLTSSIAIFFKYKAWRKNNDVDLVHSHGHFGIWIYLYRRFLKKHFPWAKELKAPLVVHFHNTVRGRKVKLEESGSEIKPISKFVDWPLAELSDRLAIKTGNAYVFVSEDLKKEAIEYYKADPKKCFVVESGVNTETFMPVSPEEKVKTRIELKVDPLDKIILNAGALVERKNIHLLVESLKHLPSKVKLMLMGSGDSEYMDRINKTISDNKLKDRVIMVGYTPYPQIPIAYQTADIFVLPSNFEGLPKVVTESLACGTQVLASGFRFQEEINGMEYLEKIEAEYIADRIVDMLSRPRTVDRHKVMRICSWDVKAHEMEHVYEYVKKNLLK